MGTIWTPGGEHAVGDEPGGTAPPTAASAPPRSNGEPAPMAGQPPADAADEELMAEMAEVQRQLLETPVRVVVTNHAIGLFQLAALHLNQRPPDLDQGRLAIDAMAALVEGLAGRWGEEEEPLRDALSQVRLAFVQLSGGNAGPSA